MTNPNDPAFSAVFDWKSDGSRSYKVFLTDGGLTKREYFAAMAMSALVIHREVQLDHESKLPADAIARMAIAQSDALIAELNKENGSPSDTVSDSSGREAR